MEDIKKEKDKETKELKKELQVARKTTEKTATNAKKVSFPVFDNRVFGSNFLSASRIICMLLTDFGNTFQISGTMVKEAKECPIYDVMS